MKKLVFPLIFTVMLCLIFTGCIVDTNTALQCTDYTANIQELIPTTNINKQIDTAPSMAAGHDTGIKDLSHITNFAIFICFMDEDITDVQNGISDYIIDMFNGQTNSLRHYYQELSFGDLTIETVFPRNSDNSYFVYQAPRNRDYYKRITASSGPERNIPESTLLNAAVAEANDKFDYTDATLDGNDDNYIDMVSFVVSGSHCDGERDWGGLLWPHAWSLDPITSNIDYSSAKLNNICVNEFSFTFIDSYQVGYICHETGHILGMPDLYHYKNDTKRYPVGYWDLMHYNCSTPQFVTTYMRSRYLDFVNESQIVTLVQGGSYTLKPTTIAKRGDILAYKIELGNDESVWIEYRNNRASLYDCQLSGSGLVVYRINNKARGNEQAKYKSTANPDEVYVYRPIVTGNSEGQEATNLQYAYVSSSNEHFPKIGVSANFTAKYNQSAIYLTDGTNTGIIITPTEQDNGSISFTVDLSEYDQSAVTEIKVFDQPYEMYYGETPQPNVKIKYNVDMPYYTPRYSKLSFTYTNEIGTQRAIVSYIDDQNNISTYFDLVIKDKVAVGATTLINTPYVTEYDIDESVDLAGLLIKITTLSGVEETKAYTTNNSEDWSLEGVDFTQSGTYGAVVSYLPLNVYVIFEIKILTSLSGITILAKDTVTIIRTGETPTLNVVGVNADGSYRNLQRNEYRVEPYESNNYWTQQQLTVTYLANTDYTCTTSLYVVEGNLVRINVTNPTKTQYNFGSKLDLSGGELRFDYEKGNASIALDSYYSKFNAAFSPNKAGVQSLSVRINGYNCTFIVKVLSQTPNLLSVIENEKDFINISGTAITLKKEYTLRDLQSAFMSYLDIAFLYNDNLYINSNSFPNMKMGNKIKLILSNGEHKISSYTIILMGDTNGNGELNNLDVNGMVLALMQERTNLPYLDINNDGYYTLTDFVLWIALLEAK